MKTEQVKGNIVDIIAEKIFPGIITIQNSKIVKIEADSQQYDNYIIPGFIDSHVHVESSMLTPVEFSRIALKHGTVAVVTDPHEIANVMGIDGVKFMLENGKLSPLKFYFSAPSCVPATEFETSGGKLGPEELEQLLQKDEIKYLGEFMNYPDVIKQEPIALAKLELAKKYHKMIDGHAPELVGDALTKYAAAGISTDHECLTSKEALEKIKLGMKILIREGSACKDFENLIEIAHEHWQDCMFCCDDLHPNDLLKGHINLIVKRALAAGLNIFKVLQMASLNPIEHYDLDAGLLQEGDSADFLVVNDLEEFRIIESYINGEKVVKQEKVKLNSQPINKINNFNVSVKSPEDFSVPKRNGSIRVIVAQDGIVTTGKKIWKPTIYKDKVVCDLKEDVLKIVVINRYENTRPAVGFISGFGLQKGAIASSVAHDSHNIVAVGVSDEEITNAVNLLIMNKGGICATNGNLEEFLPLPIAGIISDKTCNEVAANYENLELTAKKLGCKLNAPFMTLSFMALLVIPELKMSDKGLFDSSKFEFVDLWLNNQSKI